MIEVKVTKTLIVSIGEQKMTLTEEQATDLLDQLIGYFQPEEEQEDFELDEDKNGELYVVEGSTVEN